MTVLNIVIVTITMKEMVTLSSITDVDIQRVLHSPFDIETHKRTFVQYLEVCLDETGHVHYAVPSHQEWLIQHACNKHNMTREELENSCPRERWADYMLWLTEQTSCIAVWDGGFIGRSNYMQQVTLTMLKANGVYFGATKEGPEGYVI